MQSLEQLHEQTAANQADVVRLDHDFELPDIDNDRVLVNTDVLKPYVRARSLGALILRPISNLHNESAKAHPIRQWWLEQPNNGLIIKQTFRRPSADTIDVDLAAISERIRAVNGELDDQVYSQLATNALDTVIKQALHTNPEEQQGLTTPDILGDAMERYKSLVAIYNTALVRTA